MKKQLLFASMLSLSLMAVGQAELSTWKLNSSGYSASYYTSAGGSTLYYYTDEADVQEICYDNDNVWISCTGLSTEMGPWTNPGNPTNQDYLFKITRNPSVAATKVEAPTVNSVGVLINGIPIFGLSDARSYSSTSNTNETMGGDGNWWGEAYYTEGTTLDPMGCHPQQTGAFHSHALATPLWEDTPVSEHSPIIGWAWDGNPIYGPYGYTAAMNASSGVTKMSSSYQLRTMTDRTTLADGSASIPPGPSDFTAFPIGNYIQDFEYVNSLGTLDEYNGRNCVTPEYPAGTYAYFTTIDAGGVPEFPYYIGIEYYGEPNLDNNSNTVTASTSCLQYTGTSGVSKISNSEIVVYPNPIEDELFVQLDDNVLVLEIFTIEGDRIASVKNTKVMSLNELSSGIYFVKLTTKTGAYTKKIIKK